MSVNAQTIVAVSFLVLLDFWLILNRKRIHLKKILFPLLYVTMYRTQLGLRFIDKFVRIFSGFMRIMGHIGIVIGFIWIVFVYIALVQNLIQLVRQHTEAIGVLLVLPSDVKISFPLPFFYWLILIFIIALIHEFSKGILARTYDMRIKSSGLAVTSILIPVLPVPFIELNEKELQNMPKRQQLSVFAVGPLSNIMLAYIALAIFAFFGPIVVNNVLEFKGVIISDFVYNHSPAKVAGLQRGEIIYEMDRIPINYVSNFAQVLKSKSPGDTVNLKTDHGVYNVKLVERPYNDRNADMGILVRQNRAIREDIKGCIGSFLPTFALSLVALFYWIYLLNLGAGLGNFVPLGKTDGGKMLMVALEKYFPEEKAQRIWKYVRNSLLVLILFNILALFIM